jgi:hypothetical protein
LGIACESYSNSGLLRTAFMVACEKLSELGATSDSFRIHRGKAVRTWGNFGQLSWSQVKSCPNSGLLLTAFVVTGEKLSELGTTSDSFRRRRGKAVRTRGYFGQLSSLQGISCPNSGLLRTALVLAGEKLSKLGATSDNFGARRPKAVQTRGYFGQLLWSQGKSWPNSGLLRTAFVVAGEKLSELGATSDSFRRHRGKAVQTRGYFGQLLWSQVKSWPNLGLLRTTLVLADQKLSELEATLDNFRAPR